MEENYIKNEGRNVVSINSLIILAYRVVLSIGTVNRLYRAVEVAHHDYMPGMERGRFVGLMVSRQIHVTHTHINTSILYAS